MSRAEELWERLVRAALRRERFGIGSVGHPAGGIAGYVPSSLNNRDIDTILRVADEIQDEEPNVARILCEHAYSLAQNLDPNSEGRGVLQFKTGLMSVIKQKLAKREVGTIDRSQDVARLLEFYRLYREKNNVDKLREEEMMLRESGVFSGNLGECAFHLFSLLSLCPFGCWSLEESMLGTLVNFAYVFTTSRSVNKRSKDELIVACYVMHLLDIYVGAEDIEKEKGFWNAKSIGDGIGAVDRRNTCRVPAHVATIFFEQLKRVIESDAAMTEDLIAYNIIPFPLDAPTITNAIVSFPEVRAAVSALKHYRSLPKLPSDFSIPETRSPDLMDFLHYVFGFQKDNVSNQREHVVLLLANEQSRHGIPEEPEPVLEFAMLGEVVALTLRHLTYASSSLLLLNLIAIQDGHVLNFSSVVWSSFLVMKVFYSSKFKSSGLLEKLDEAAVQKVFLKSLDNYIKWCNYLCIQPVWSSLDAVSKEKKVLFVSLYFLIWGEAANIRFLPECLCYIFHHMAREMDEALRQQIAQPANSCSKDGVVSFLDQVITPLYDVVAAEAANNENGRAPHSAWRNYDDFNEYFWSLHCFDLSWPWRKTSFFQKPEPSLSLVLGGCVCLFLDPHFLHFCFTYFTVSMSFKWRLEHCNKYCGSFVFITMFPNPLKLGGGQHRGKTSFVEHRTFFHLYHSFHRLWIFLVMMFQGLTIIAFNNGHLNAKTLREVLSLGPTFVVMKFTESVLDVIMMYGAYSTTRRLAVSRIFLRFIWFGVASVVVSFLYVRALQEESKPNSNSVVFRLYLIVIGIYGGIHFFISFLMRIPACHRLTELCDQFSLIRFIKWMRQERYYVGRGMYERTTDFIKYMIFWLIILSGKFAFAYFFQIKPLVKPTRTVIAMDNIEYSWHDFVSRNNHNALTVVSLWAPVIAMYLLDIYIFYTVLSAVWGFLLGARDRLGEIRSLDAVQKLFEEFPEAFMKRLHPVRASASPSSEVVEKSKFDAARFSPFWNEIIKNLREEDYLTNFEMELLFMPKNTGKLPLVQWPLFLLASKIFLAKDIAAESRDSQDELWERISRDEYMKYAVQECYYALRYILTAILEAEGRTWIYEGIEASITKKTISDDFQLNKLQLVISRVTALLGILLPSPHIIVESVSGIHNGHSGTQQTIEKLDKNQAEKPEHEKGAVKAVQDLYDVVRHDVLAIYLREHSDQWQSILKARTEGRLFAKLNWPRDPELKAQVKRLYSLLTIKDSASNVPKNLEARRRLEFFTNSLFMDMPPARPVQEMLSFRL
ncbi:hypothetical protein GOBAR_AA15234 [Gossypium barbadense]|uniref:1,3-beta-glucan synthase component FKS1-like domain-containing protein n=1 Tax=Gossypium barbadense TaxID=3634 RepID=A0A2P5XQ75_GOSBA|nr:hypothetical protein GOBAR_AA15234 [Gossypium barbadense]